MTRYVLAALLAIGCAAPQVAKAPARWSAALVYSVVRSCGAAGMGTLRECGCFAEALEKVSPDPDSKATDAELNAAAAACGLTLPEAEPESGSASGSAPRGVAL